MLALAAVAFITGAIVGAHRGSSPSMSLAESYARAWTRGDYAEMYGDITPAAQRETSPGAFAAAHRDALKTATATAEMTAGRARSVGNGHLEVPVRVRTRMWGTLALPMTLDIVSIEGSQRVDWSPSVAFPGVPEGATLTRSTTLPRRATLLARDGKVMAESPPEGEPGGRSLPLGEAFAAVVGEVGAIPSARRAALEAEGVPPEAEVGTSGLELALDARLRGRPGGELLAGGKVLASTPPHAGHAVRTTISPPVQEAAVAALGSQLGGVVAMQPASGQILAVAGIGLNGLQPPGSTFKMITVSGALSAHVATPHTTYPYATYATLDGVRLNNANGEECGGSLELAFAVSCNSVFTPLGVKLGAGRLVAMAEAFGFNHDPGVPGADRSTLPAAGAIQGELAVGSAAIGQGEVLATPLQMATVAATIADGGHRPAPALEAEAPRGAGAQALTPAVARTVRHLMTEVVREGTGTSAAIPGVVVAGKTGTAELKTCSQSSGEGGASATTSHEASEGCAGGESGAANTDAWFAAFAPAVHPKVAVCVMLVKDGAGGDTAAPVARQILEAGLR
jgi:cell division protein FtsI/penicillin-binding protein 2